MATREHNARQIEKAAAAVGRSGAHLYAARTYAERFSALPPTPFGTLPSPSLVPAYDAGRDSQLRNLGDAYGRLDAMTRGMAEVARAYRQTEHANQIGWRREDQVEITPPKGEPADVDVSRQLLAGGVATVAALAGARYHGIALTGARLAPAAAVATVWAGCLIAEPDRVDQVAAGWDKVAEELGKVDVRADVETALSETDWNGEARATFDEWVASFQTEVGDAKRAAEETATSVRAALDELLDLNLQLWGFGMLILVLIIIANLIGVLFPPLRPAAETQKAVHGCTLAIVTLAAVAAIMASLGLTGTAITRASEHTSGGFGKMEIGLGGERTFLDLGITWDRL